MDKIYGISPSNRLAIKGLYILNLLAVMPSWYFINSAYPGRNIPSPVVLALLNIGLGILVSTVALSFSSRILTRIKLDPFDFRSLQHIVHPAIAVGILLGLASLALEKLIPLPPGFASHLHPYMLPKSAPLWLHLSRCSYISTEVLIRLCLFPFILLLFGNDFSSSQSKLNSFNVWIAILVSSFITGLVWIGGFSLLSGVSRLMMLIMLFEVVISEMIFCWLFLRNGFWASALAGLIACLVTTSGSFLLH